MIEVRANSFLSSHDWKENIPCPVPVSKMEQWQERLNRIFGTIDGHPVVRVLWGQSPQTWQFNRYHKEYTPKYDWGYVSEFVTDPATGIDRPVRTWIGLPRLILERALKPQAETVSDQAGHDQEGYSVAKRVNASIEYRLYTINGTRAILVQHSDVRTADGEHACCAERRRQGIGTCYGDFREMDDLDFDILLKEEKERLHQARISAAEQITLN